MLTDIADRRSEMYTYKNPVGLISSQKTVIILKHYNSYVYMWYMSYSQ